MRALAPSAISVAVLAVGWLGLLLPLPAFAAPPDEGECPSISPRGPDGRPDTDATPLIVKQGMKVNAEGLLALQTLLPREVWRHRETFFFEGMLMEIGPCHRRYPVPNFFAEATQKHAPGVALDEQGNLSNYVAGTPFPQASIDPDDPMAATRWAWNLEKRFRGAGHRGRFRITDLPSRMGTVMHYEGEFFAFQAAGRADLAETDYRSPDTKNLLWATGGGFTAPFGARELAWRQFRTPASQTSWSKPDDIFVYIPSLRKTRRSGTSWVDGAFMPRYTVADQSQGWPVTQGRNYGTSGLSVAADRWDVRHAVVIEGRLRQRSETIRSVTIYIDYQTLQPLYWISHTGNRRLVEVGILVHRFGGDQPQQPRWPDDSPNRVFEPVAASFVNALAGRGGWLRESHSLESLPFTPSAVRRMTTTSALDRGR